MKGISLARVPCIAIVAASLAPGVFADLAADIMQKTGIKGGVVLHVGCGDAELTAALRIRDSYLVQGLETDPEKVETARRKLRQSGANGPVAIVLFDGKHLPYVDNLVNLVVSEDRGSVAMDEIMRVLAPYGVAYIKEGGAWQKTVKPVPPDTDEWTHYLHDPSNNALSTDDRIHPPRHMQWVGSPRYSRHHDHMSAMSACVTAGGRIYHTMDESPRLSIFLPPTWKLIARDAFNGTLLWKRDIDEWYTHMHRLKSGPAFLPRKLVAIGNILYAAAGIHAAAEQIDGATGKTLQTYVPDMETDEILYSDGVLFLVGSAPNANSKSVDPRAILGTEPRRVVAVQADDGKVLWSIESKVLALTLTVDAEHVYFHDAKQIVCLDRNTGKEIWQSEPLVYWERMAPYFAPTLVAYKDVILFAGGKGYVPHRGSKDKMVAMSAKDGRTLWTGDHPPSGYQSPEDILVVDGLAWCGAFTGGRDDGVWIGRDPLTGEEKKRFPPTVKTYWFHHRCYRAKATENYLLLSRTGVEFVDHKKEDWTINHWIRGACLYGIMPANGLLYVPQHPCACYPEAKLNGFNALSSQRDAGDLPPLPAVRLVKGPACGKAVKPDAVGAADWPTFRHDAQRSGSTAAEVPNALTRGWRIDLGTRLSQPVVAGGKVYVSAVDAHTIHALDEASGETAWTFVAGGRVDSSPTIYRNLVMFGCTDGWVYCLRADDGELAWRFQAAPQDLRVCCFEQVESVWPVPGSILIQDNVAYFAAGRSIFLDGGVRLYRLNPVTGEMLSETVLSDVDPDGKKIQDYIDWLNMPAGLPDILSCDGRQVYMRSQPFDLNGKRTRVDRLDVKNQRGDDVHLFCPSGFLDGSWWHRTYQVYGQSFSGGHSGYSQAGKFTPSGKIMTFDDEHLYAFGRKPQYYKWTTPIEHQLFSTVKKIPPPPKQPARAKGGGSPGSMVRFENTASLDPTGTPLAVEAWVNAQAGNGVVLARGGPANGYALTLAGGKPRFMIRTDGDIHVASGTTAIIGKWVHLAGVLTRKHELRLYVNGELEGEKQALGLISALPIQATEIGADDAGSVGDYPTPSFFKGMIDEVRIYHGELGPSEIKRHATGAGIPTVAKADLVLHCSFDKGDASDASGKNNNGALQSVKAVAGKFGKAMSFPGAPAKAARRKRQQRQAFPYRWTQEIPLFARAMVKAGDKLIVAGPEDVIDEEKVKTMLDSPEVKQRLQDQLKMLAGQKGGLLWMVSAETGEKLAEYTLDVPPIFDGMIAANGKIFISTMDGAVECLKGK